jgi:hypothetical protein
MITQDDLRDWLNYNPHTGVLTWWRVPERSRIKIGDEAGSIQTVNGKQRVMLWLLGMRIYRSRAAYIYVHGDIATGVLIDHRDGDTLNDRIENLRPASSVQNNWNRLHRKGGFKLGVSSDAMGRFKARIQPTGMAKINLGTWDTEAEAHAAYMGAAAILHSDFWIGYRTAHQPVPSLSHDANSKQEDASPKSL